MAAKKNAAKKGTASQNSSSRAKGGAAYVPVPPPGNLEELRATINMWATYLEQWGIRVKEALESGGQGGHETEASGPSHLDPPPPPYT